MWSPSRRVAVDGSRVPVAKGRETGTDRRMPPETVITPYRDGPLLVRGPVRLLDQDGATIFVDREVVALCHCGRSRTRPLCDGTHKLAGFRAPSGLEDRRGVLSEQGALASPPAGEDMLAPASVEQHQGASTP